MGIGMKNRSVADLWLPHADSSPAAIRLFCFPYAGGGAILFRRWQDSFTRSIRICPVQLPGRGNRIQETPFTSVEPLADVLTQVLLPYLDRPFAFFGHSMGGIICFEIA